MSYSPADYNATHCLKALQRGADMIINPRYTDKPMHSQTQLQTRNIISVSHMSRYIKNSALYVQKDLTLE